MSVPLHTSSPLYAIQAEFSKNFPGLKLEFIFHGDEKLNLSSNLHFPFFSTPINEIYPDCDHENITIEESMTVKEVETIFNNHWHLPAQVYVIKDGYWQKNKTTGSKQLKDFNNYFAASQ